MGETYISAGSATTTRYGKSARIEYVVVRFAKHPSAAYTFFGTIDVYYKRITKKRGDEVEVCSHRENCMLNAYTQRLRHPAITNWIVLLPALWLAYRMLYVAPIRAQKHSMHIIFPSRIGKIMHTCAPSLCALHQSRIRHQTQITCAARPPHYSRKVKWK